MHYKAGTASAIYKKHKRRNQAAQINGVNKMKTQSKNSLNIAQQVSAIFKLNDKLGLVYTNRSQEAKAISETLSVQFNQWINFTTVERALRDERRKQALLK